MIDYTPTLVSELGTILPIHYELFVDSSTTTPCLTFMKVGDTAQEEGDNIRYSRVAYQIKIWADDYEVISTKSLLLDAKMKTLGFTRTQYNELWYNNHCSAIFRYEALNREE